MSDHSDPRVNRRWAQWRQRVDLDEYEQRFDELATSGVAVHGEADAVSRLLPNGGSVLDAGCGTGRIAIELADRGYEVVGVDVDPEMLSRARRRRPDCTWLEADLRTVDLAQKFDLILLAGNVMIFLPDDSEAATVANLSGLLNQHGLLVAGFSLRLDLAAYDAMATAAGLVLADRTATWEGAPYEGGDYAVSIHCMQPG